MCIAFSGGVCSWHAVCVSHLVIIFLQSLQVAKVCSFVSGRMDVHGLGAVNGGTTADVESQMVHHTLEKVVLAVHQTKSV